MIKKIANKVKGAFSRISTRVQLAALALCSSVVTFAQNAAGNYEAGTTALTTVSEEINFGVNPTKYNTCIKSYLPNNSTSYTMNYSVKVNFNNT